MMVLITFFRLWFGMITEVWQDAKLIHNKEVQEAFRSLKEELDKDEIKKK